MNGEVVVTKNEAGQIVAVTRQDEEGRVLSVISTSAKIEPPTVLVFMEGGMVTHALCDKPVTVKVIDYDTEGTGLEDDELDWIPQTDYSPSTAACVSDESSSPNPKRVAEIMRAINRV